MSRGIDDTVGESTEGSDPPIPRSQARAWERHREALPLVKGGGRASKDAFPVRAWEREWVRGNTHQLIRQQYH